MSICDAQIQIDYERDILRKKIKDAEKKYYNESPCKHCGPGNGCDDCRGCEDAKINYQLEMDLRNLQDEYKKKYGISLAAEELWERAKDTETRYNEMLKHCKKCGATYDEKCKTCTYFTEKQSVERSLNWQKDELKRNYNLDLDGFHKLSEALKGDEIYDDLAKSHENRVKSTLNSILPGEWEVKLKLPDGKEYKLDKPITINSLEINKDMKDDLLVQNGDTIEDWINYNVRNNGAKNFFDCINNAWDDGISESVKQAILDQIHKQIKPETINTIEDLAKLLDGNEYRDEFENESDINIDKLCEEKGWVVVFGQSDDLIEFRGAIDKEDGAWEGTMMKLVRPGDFYADRSDCYENDDEDTYRKAKEYDFVGINNEDIRIMKEHNYFKECVVEMLWCPDDSTASWQVNVKGAPVAKFNIMDEEELYCEAAVIDISEFLKK